MAWAFKNAIVKNINSRYDAWAEDAEYLLKELDKRPVLSNAVNSVAMEDVKERASELKHLFLVDKITFQKSYKVVVGGHYTAPIGIPSAGEHDPRSPIDDLCDKVKGAHEYDEDDKRPEDEWPEEYPGLENAGIINEPYHGEDPGSTITLSTGRVITRRIIIDCYGIYVTSARDYFHFNPPRQVYNPQSKVFLQQLDIDQSLDGPAVILCPELIETIHHNVILSGGIKRDSRLRIRLDRNPQLTFLKTVLYHEIGHHMFPVDYSKSNGFLSEAFANWFLYHTLDSNERLLMFEKTRLQSEVYQAYEGLLAIALPMSLRFPLKLNNFRYDRMPNYFTAPGGSYQPFDHFSSDIMQAYGSGLIGGMERGAFYGDVIGETCSAVDIYEVANCLENNIEDLFLNNALFFAFEIVEDLAFGNCFRHARSRASKCKVMSGCKDRRWREKMWLQYRE